MRTSLLILMLLSTIDICYGQDSLASHKTKKERHLTMYTCGFSEYEPDSCFLKTTKNYGFYSKDLGCFVNKKIQRQFNKNNRKVERRLVKTYGKGWRKNFKKDLELCRLREGWGTALDK